VKAFLKQLEKQLLNELTKELMKYWVAPLYLEI